MKNDYYVGIDPGKSGAIAVLSSDGSKLEVYDLPVDAGGEVDEIELSFHLGTHIRLVAIEKVNGNPAWGSSNFAFGRCFGQILATVRLKKNPLERVTPKRWQKVILEGRKHTKSEVLRWARERWPEVEFKRHDHADAAALAEYARRTAGPTDQSVALAA